MAVFLGDNIRLTFTGLQNYFLDYIGFPGSTDTNTLNFFYRNVNTAYQFVLAELSNFTTQIPKTAATVVNQQFYHNPVGIQMIESATVQVGSIYYPLWVVNSQYQWDLLNEVLITTSAIPQFIFPRRDDFGIYPIPQGVYTIQLNFNLRDRNLTNADIFNGTVTVTNNSQTVTNSGSNFSASMAGRWFSLTNATANGGSNDYWYRITSATTTTLTLETSYEGATATGQTYLVGESPELPEEAHELIALKVASDWFAGPRKDLGQAEYLNNMFWTGNGAQKPVPQDDIRGGLIGLKMRYAQHSNDKIVRRQPKKTTANTKIWASRIT